ARRWLLQACLCFFVVACGAPTPPPSTTAPGILLFAGRGTSPNDVAALEGILRARSLSHRTASSDRLDAMSETELQTYRLLIVPGGNFEQIGGGLGSSTTTRVRDAI